MREPIELFKVFMAPTAAEAVSRVLSSGYIGQGPKVEEFEADLRSFFGFERILTLNSGTSAIHLALHLLQRPDPSRNWPGLNPGDEVLTTALTCTASNWPMLAHGLHLRWVDIDPTTLNFDLEDLAAKLSPKTKLILVMHWGGHPNNLHHLRAIQQQAETSFGFLPALLEEGAHSFGSRFEDQPVGTHGNLTVFSLNAIKHITSVDGGLLLCPHPDLYTRGKLVRWYGVDREGQRRDFRCEADIAEWGYKFHMNDVSAAVGIENLRHAPEILRRHRENARFYDESLRGIPGITLLKREPQCDSAFWIYSLLVERRDAFFRWMNACGITVSQVHERNDKHSCVRQFRTPLPVLDRTIGKIVSIPAGWWVSDSDREYIAACIRKGW